MSYKNLDGNGLAKLRDIIKGDLAALKTELSLTAGDNITIDKNVISANFDTLKVGGINLVKGTKTPTVLPASENANSYVLFSYGATAGTEYTASFDLDVTDGTFADVQIFPAYGSMPSVYMTVQPHISLTFTTTDPMYSGGNQTLVNRFIVYAGRKNETAGNGIIISNLKIEHGNVATDWTQAPEDDLADMQKYIDDAVLGGSD